MKNNFTFAWTIEEKFDISLNFDEFHNEVEVADIADNSLTEEKNHYLNILPLKHRYDIKSGDFNEAANTLTDPEELQKELRDSSQRQMESISVRM